MALFGAPRPPSTSSWASSEAVRATMRGNRRRDTKPEVALRRLLHQRGLRYRVDAAPLPGLRRRADVLFTRRRIAVFVDGCFWHGCPDHGSVPRTNPEYWQAKVAANQARDADTDARLGEARWLVMRIWEHEDMAEAAALVEAAWRSAGSQR